MATIEEIQAKQSEFNAAFSAMDVARNTYEMSRDPYFAARQVYRDAIGVVDRIDDELESLQADYEPPTPPGPE